MSGSVQLAGMMVLGKPREIQAWSLKKSLFLSREVGINYFLTLFIYYQITLLCLNDLKFMKFT